MYTVQNIREYRKYSSVQCTLYSVQSTVYSTAMIYRTPYSVLYNTNAEQVYTVVPVHRFVLLPYEPSG
jgi:hypothetical protein